MSVHGSSRHFAAVLQGRRFWSKAGSGPGFPVGERLGFPDVFPRTAGERQTAASGRSAGNAEGGVVARPIPQNDEPNI
jgi:hypothetical protein